MHNNFDKDHQERKGTWAETGYTRLLSQKFDKLRTEDKFKLKKRISNKFMRHFLKSFNNIKTNDL